MRNSWGQESPLSNTIKDASTIMRNPLLEYVGRGVAFARKCSYIRACMS